MFLVTKLRGLIFVCSKNYLISKRPSVDSVITNPNTIKI